MHSAALGSPSTRSRTGTPPRSPPGPAGRPPAQQGCRSQARLCRTAGTVQKHLEAYETTACINGIVWTPATNVSVWFLRWGPRLVVGTAHHHGDDV